MKEKQPRTRKLAETHPGMPPQTQDALEGYVEYLVNRLSSVGQAARNRKLSAMGINLVTLRTLSVLHIHGTLTVNEIAARAFAEQSTASRAIDNLVSAGLVERRVSTEDLRRRELALTEAGSAILHQCWPLIEDHHGSFLKGVDPDDLDVCRRVLLQMIDNVRRDAR